MVQYDWEILSLYTSSQENGLNDVVKRATWRYQAKDGSYVADVFKDTFFDSPDPNQYKNFENLNSDIVVDWILEKINLDELKAELNVKLNEIKNPTRVIEKPKPWSYESAYTLDDMYVLFHEGEVLHGPVRWHSDSFNTKLQSVNLNPSFPGDIHARQRKILPISEPLIVNAATNTILYKCELLNDQPENSIYDRNDYLEWNLDVWPVVGTYQVISKSVEEIKANIKDRLANMRSDKDVAGTTVTLQGRQIKVGTGHFSRLLIIQKLTTMGEQDTTLWKFIDNSWLSLSKPEVQILLSAVDQYVDDLNEWEYNIIQQINAADSVDALKNIEIENIELY